MADEAIDREADLLASDAADDWTTWVADESQLITTTVSSPSTFGAYGRLSAAHRVPARTQIYGVVEWDDTMPGGSLLAATGTDLEQRQTMPNGQPDDGW